MGLKVCVCVCVGGGGGTNIPLPPPNKKVGARAHLDPPPPPRFLRQCMWGCEICGKSFHLCYGGSSDRSFMVDALSYFSLHNWCNNGRDMFYPVYVESASLNKTFPSFFPSFHILF